MFVGETAWFRVDTEPPDAKSGIQVEGEKSSQGDYLLIGETEHLRVFGRIWAVPDELFVQVYRYCEVNLDSFVLCGEHEHELDERSVGGILIGRRDIGEMIIFESLGEVSGFEWLSVETGVSSDGLLLLKGETFHLLYDVSWRFCS